MYEAHFGLTAPLVAPGIARGERVYVGDGTRRQAERRLASALARGNAVTLLSGAAGTGKTTLAAHAVRARATRLALGWIAHAPQRPPELLEQLLAEFGITPEVSSHAGALSTWQQFLNEMAVTETSVCVLVEHADELGTDVLRALELLTAADPSGCPGANVVLTARTSLAERLRTPTLTGLAQRVGANIRLDPLDVAETRRYLEFALAVCGGRLDDIFEASAVEALQARSGGIIRVIDNLAECTLSRAAESGAARVDAALVDAVATELGGTGGDECPAHETGRLDPGRPGPADEAPGAGAENRSAVTAGPAGGDVPVLTDAVDAPDDALVHDALESASAALAEDAPHEHIDGGPEPPLLGDVAESGIAAEPEPGHPTAPSLEDEDDAEADSAEAMANALEFEDFSNYVAETVFGEAELLELEQTLAKPERADEKKLTGT